jgi:hypothetical protein
VQVQDDVVVEGHAEEDAEEAKLVGGLKGIAVEPVEVVLFMVLEHAVAHVEELLQQQLEEFLLNAAFVDALWATRGW